MAELSHKEYVEKQYQKSDNLSTRISIHDKYSVNKLGLNNWYFTFYEIKEGMKILELGCGTGTLWMDHKEELAKCEQVVLSDFSEGMIETAKKNLGDPANVQFKTIDIQDIPFADDTFDIVIANYMLYHVPEIKKGLSEVKRVLKKDGFFYAGTTSEVSIMDHVAKYLEMDLHYDVAFSLENGGKQLEPFFATVEKKIYEDALEVTNLDDLVDYMFTGDIFKSACPFTKEEVKEKLTKYMVNGCLRIPKQPGAFVCVK